MRHAASLLACAAHLSRVSARLDPPALRQPSHRPRACFSAPPHHILTWPCARLPPNAVLSDPALRNAYDKATEFDVESMALEEYLRRFTNLILTVNGLGHVGLGWGDEAEDMDPELLAFFGAPSFVFLVAARAPVVCSC